MITYINVFIILCNRARQFLIKIKFGNIEIREDGIIQFPYRYDREII